MVNTSLAMFSPYWEGRLYISTFCLFVSSSTLLHYEKESFVAATLSYEKKKKKKQNNVNNIAQNIGCGYTLEPPR